MSGKSLTLIFMCASSFLSTASANQPALRPQPSQKFRSITAKALCKDEIYECMYKCSIEENGRCTPTKGSDRNCPVRKLAQWFWISETKVDIILDDDVNNTNNMGCRILSHWMTNRVCSDDGYNEVCRVGRFHR
jgi:hypothetical protein